MTKIRKIIAEADTDEGKVFLGKMELRVPKKGKSATVENVRVEKEFRRKGIAKNLYERAAQFLERANKKFLRSSELMSTAPVKIRQKEGQFRVGGKARARTRYFADQFGPYGEQTRRIQSKAAIEIIKQNKTPASTGRMVTATTMLKKRRKGRK